MNRIRFWWRYLRGEIPWDNPTVPPEIIRLADSLPPGHSLDLGCGTGNSSLYLAGRGWHAVGVDFVQIAIRMARRKAKAAHASAEFYCADVTKLGFLKPSFDLIYDIGCFHSLSAEIRERYVDQLRQLAHPGASYALYAHQPRLLNDQTFGVTPEEVTRLFAPAFTVTNVESGQDRGTGPASAWYFLRRV